uniref:Uncharacterized protein n=2 Tax=Viruses TaxID=10239 RepID=A0A8S5PIS9_9CAUD|nr:MAG TPA: hypothetical protein [Myoviridae sp. ct0jJ30]DAE31773.1 MAG TPA: hypothetical protein [virus sp. ctBM815]
MNLCLFSYTQCSSFLYHIHLLHTILYIGKPYK